MRAPEIDDFETWDEWFAEYERWVEACQRRVEAYREEQMQEYQLFPWLDDPTCE